MKTKQFNEIVPSETIELSEYVTAIIRLHCGRSGIKLASLKQTEQKDEFAMNLLIDIL